MTRTEPDMKGPSAGRRPRRINVAMVLVLVLAAVAAVGGSLGLASHDVSAGADSICQGTSSIQCTASIPCPTTGSCPTVTLTPVEGVDSGQFVFLSATDFPSGDTIRAALCSTSVRYSPDPSDPQCLRGQWSGLAQGPVQTPVAVDAGTSNLTKVSVPVFAQPSGDGNSAMPSDDISGQKSVGPGIFCDNSGDSCAIVVTLEVGVGNVVGDGPTISTSNSLVVPITFANSSTGCPTADPEVEVDGSFSVEHFLPSAIDATCAGTNGVVALDTTNDNQSIVSDFVHGGTKVAFLDTPSDPDVQAQLAGRGYAYIPIAVSGTAVGFLAAGVENGVPYPISSYNMTPTMLAGVLTSAYQEPDGSSIVVNGKAVPAYSDNLMAGMAKLTPPVTCSNLVGCYESKKKGSGLEALNELAFNTFNLLNPVASDVEPPQNLGAFMSNVSNGASYQGTDWICSAPNVAVPVTVNEEQPPAGETNPITLSVQDTNLASTELTEPPSGSTIWPPYTSASQPYGPPWVFPTCNGYSTFPAISGSADYAESQAPSFQAKAIRTFAYEGNNSPGQTNSPSAGFGLMDSSEADFNGLNTASLQNADGAFVAPTSQSIETAAAAMTPCPTADIACPGGTFSVSYTTAPSAAAYPLPNVTYALVSTSAQPAATASAIKDLLTNLVTYSHTAGTALPGGYAPLPDAMYQAALSDISQDIVSEPATTTTKSGSSGDTSSTNSSSTSSGGSPGSYGGSGLSSGASAYSSASIGLPYEATSSTGASNGASGSGGNASSTSPTNSTSGSTGTPTSVVLLSLDETSRYLLPAMVLIGALFLIAGPLLYFTPAYRRRRSARRSGE
jgi:hypothetical protein